MTLGEMIERVRRQLPSATVESVSDAIITSELNVAVNKTNIITRVYKGYKDFTLTVNKQTYSLLTDVDSNYIGREKRGVVYYNASSESSLLIPKTAKWLDLSIPNWRDASASEPQYYYIDADDLVLYPKPSVANTLRVHFVKKATAMDDNDNYPWFNLPTGSGVLESLDDAIVAYAVWKLSPAVGKEAQKPSLEDEFLRYCQMGKTQINKAPDLTSDDDYEIKINI